MRAPRRDRATDPDASAADGTTQVRDPLTHETVRLQDRQQDVALKRRYAHWLLWVLVTQLLVADVVFVVYAQVGRSWELSTAVVDSWLAATLLEVVGIVYVVTQYLFPRRDDPG